MLASAVKLLGKKPKPKLKPIELKTPPEQTQTISRVIFDVVKEHGPLTIADTWEHIKDVGLRGLTSKRHMKIILRWMRERQKLRLICNHVGPHKQFLYTTWFTNPKLRPSKPKSDGILQVHIVTSFVVPQSNCYAFDNSSHIYDFTSWIGHPFEQDGKDSDIVIRFCKDVESRSQTGYVDFGRFDTFHHFVTGTGHVSFVQGFYNGDLMNCEQSFDKLGRTAQVNIICGSCLNGACKGQLGCICNVAYDSTCRVFVELAVPCEKSGPRIFKGFTVGFHPRSWEVVYNGLTQLGYEALRHEFSFGTEQTRVSLYMTAISSLSTLVGKPMLKVSPDKGLEVKLSGTGESGSPPTTLSPTMLNVDWTCQKASDTPYEVAISIPVEGYEPVEFTLSKMCAYKQGRKDDATRGWATFGIFSCIFFVISTLLCCGGFIYKTRVEHQHGLDALPGMTILSACLEAVTGGGGGGGYSRVEDVNNTSINQASWERQPVSAQGSQRTSDRKYGSI